MTENTQATSETSKFYELSFHIVSSIPEDQVTGVYEAIKKGVTSAAGEISAESEPTLIDLAYEMDKVIDSKHTKYKTANFAWMKFVAEPEAIEVIKEEIDGMNDVLRYFVVKSEEETNLTSAEVADMLSDEEEVVEEAEEKTSDQEEKKEEAEKDTDDAGEETEVEVEAATEVEKEEAGDSDSEEKKEE